MLWGKILRSAHPHAYVKSINTAKAAALPGVKAVITGDDMVEFPWDKPVPLGLQDLRYISRNVLAREKVLYVGHAVAGRHLNEDCCQCLEVDRSRV
jgi:CO/xanthine dehydrogenase Mo-binding subunit